MTGHSEPQEMTYDVMGVLWRPQAGRGPWSFRTERAGRSYPEGHEFVIVYRRAAAPPASQEDT